MTPRLLTSPWSRARNFRRPGAIVFEAQLLERIRLRLDEKGEKLRQIDRVLAVVVVGRAADPASPT